MEFPRLPGALLKVKVKFIFTSYPALPTHDLSCALVTLRPDSQSCGFQRVRWSLGLGLWVGSRHLWGLEVSGGQVTLITAEGTQTWQPQEAPELLEEFLAGGGIPAEEIFYLTRVAIIAREGGKL